MTVLTEVDADHVPADQIQALETFASTLIDSSLRDLLLSLTSSVKSGAGVTLFESDAELTPIQAATRLKMSRTHLYKLMDRGEVLYHEVGRDRRIPVDELVRFEASRQQARRELAERFARAAQTRSDALDELADES